MNKKKVVLGLSGGVDSLVSAILLQNEGYQVIARSLKLSGNEKSIQEAKALAQKIGIEFGVIDVSEKFQKEIIEPYIHSYLKAETPNPCVWCNNQIKARLLFEEMKKLNADFFATGHYIQIKQNGEQHYIYKGIDPDKDQSYFLWNVDPDLLPYWKTPLGSQTKAKTKEIATKNTMGFLANKKESMGVCFIGKEGYQSFLEKHPASKDKIVKGPIYDTCGNRLGEHMGIGLYTIGQKKGLEINSRGMSVIKMDPEANSLIVGNSQELYRKEFHATNYRFINTSDFDSPKIKVIVRGIGRNPEGFCTIDFIDHKNIKINLDNPAWALAPGQPVAFYEDEKLLGGAFVV